MDFLHEHPDLWNELHRAASALPDDFKFEVEDNGHAFLFDNDHHPFDAGALVTIYKA